MCLAVKVVGVSESKTLEMVVQIGSRGMSLKDPFQGVALRGRPLSAQALCIPKCRVTPIHPVSLRVGFFSAVVIFLSFPLMSSGGLVTMMFNFCNGKV